MHASLGGHISRWLIRGVRGTAAAHANGQISLPTGALSFCLPLKLLEPLVRA